MRFVIIVVSLALVACGHTMSYMPIGATEQATDACAKLGGLESFQAIGEEAYLSLVKLHIVCKDGSKWMKEYDKPDAYHEAQALTFENGMLRSEKSRLAYDLANCKRDAEASGDNQ